MKFLGLCLVAWLLGFTGTTRAEPLSQAPLSAPELDSYRTQMLVWHLSSWGGLKLGRAGQEVELAYLGGANGYLSDAVERYNDELYVRLRRGTSQSRAHGVALVGTW